MGTAKCLAMFLGSNVMFTVLKLGSFPSLISSFLSKNAYKMEMLWKTCFFASSVHIIISNNQQKCEKNRQTFICILNQIHLLINNANIKY